MLRYVSSIISKCVCTCCWRPLDKLNKILVNLLEKYFILSLGYVLYGALQVL